MTKVRLKIRTTYDLVSRVVELKFPIYIKDISAEVTYYYKFLDKYTYLKLSSFRDSTHIELSKHVSSNGIEILKGYYDTFVSSNEQEFNEVLNEMINIWKIQLKVHEYGYCAVDVTFPIYCECYDEIYRIDSMCQSFSVSKDTFISYMPICKTYEKVDKIMRYSFNNIYNYKLSSKEKFDTFLNEKIKLAAIIPYCDCADLLNMNTDELIRKYTRFNNIDKLLNT